MRAAILLLLLAGSAAAAALPRRALLQGAPAPAAACVSVPLGWQSLMRTGEGDADSDLGLQFNKDGEAVLASDTPSDKAISTQPDYTSLLKAKDGSLHIVTQFESPQPASVYMIQVDQDKDTGILTPKNVTHIDWSKYGGIWTPCAGSTSPWGTHLGGEEYEPDARLLERATSLMGDEETSFKAVDEGNAAAIVEYLRFWKIYNETASIDEVRAVFNPYKFGYAFEVAPQGGEAYEAKKLFTLARNSKELVYVMPDEKTVYITDDGTQVAFFKFVADKAQDLSSGTLYGAKATQTDDKNGGTFDITWIELGSATDADIQGWIEGTKFSDIFEAQDPANGTCPEGFKSVNVGVMGHECLKLKAGQEKKAAFLESRRYLALLGGTTEFSKWEGITFAPSRMEGYTAMSEVRYGMEDSMKKGEADAQYDEGGPNDVRVKYNPCGCVYVLKADEAYSFTKMSPLVCGYPNANATDEANTCSTDGIGAPDNISVNDESDILFIGEDAGSQHQNDYVWAYDLNTGDMTRIFTTVYGAEATSSYWYPDINGHSYLMAVVQHPYMETDEDKLTNPFSEGPAGYLGYFTMPADKTGGKKLKFAKVPVPDSDETKSKNIGSPTVEACPKEASGPTVVTPEQEA